MAAGVECITFDREADQELACLVRHRDDAYAIVGYDSDFFVMEGVRYIPLDTLQIPKDDTGTDVHARVYTPEVPPPLAC